MRRFEETDSWLWNNVEVVSEYEGMDKYIYMETKYGKIRIYAYDVLRKQFNSFTIFSAVDKTKFFINKVKELYGTEVFTFEDTEYINSKTKVKINCNIHGNFLVKPSNILKKQSKGCQKCSKENANMMISNHSVSKKLSFEIILGRLYKIYGDKYDYSSAIYNGYSNNITIKCNKCSRIFSKRVGRHLRGSECPNCTKLESRISNDEFISRAIKVHGDKYDYKSVQYKGMNGEVKLRCMACGNEFLSNAHNHLRGSGCPKCSRWNQHKRSDWINKAKHSVHFDSYKLYIIRAYNECEDFIKIGITTKTLKKRYHCNITDTCTSLPYLYEVIEIVESEDGGHIWDLEKELLKEYREHNYMPKIYFGGITECFSIECLDKLKEDIKNIKEELQHAN